MSENLVIIGVAAGAFIGTNLDNLLLLVTLRARYERQTRSVTAGYVTGMIVIGFIAVLIGKVGDFIPLAYLGLLGVVPMTMGVLALSKLFLKSDTGQAVSSATPETPLAVFSTLVSTQLSNGTDTILAFSMLLADSKDTADYFLVPTFLAMIGVFSGLAYYLLKNGKLSRVLNRYGQYVTPVILILVGIYILSNTATDLVPG